MAILVGIIYIFPKVGDMFKSTYIAKYGSLDVVDKVTGYMFKDEKVYISKESGELNKFIKDGEVTRGRTRACEVRNQKDKEISEEEQKKSKELKEKLGDIAISSGDLITEGQGYISYYYDGYERKLNPKKIKKFSKKDLEGISQKEVKKIEKDIIKGMPAFRYISKNDWYILAFVPKSSVDRYIKGATIYIRFPDDKHLVRAYVSDIDKSGKLILYSNDYFPELTSFREGEVSIISLRETGLILEKSSITGKKDQKGVYIVNKKNQEVFVPINILGQNGDYVVVSNTFFIDKDKQRVESIKPYQEVLKKPLER